ncbi:MAG: PIG-L family deacetylase [Eubacteriales bacterium]|nr:PIG-L family deacetylase [Eubacteriales bacterium]
MSKNFQTQIYIPFGGDEKQALADTTHLAIAAHQDDVEIMAQHGILSCFERKDRHFSAVILTDGAGSPRTGTYENCTNEEMRNIRITEQKKAAVVGGYAALLLLNYPSNVVKEPKERAVVDEIKKLLMEIKPQVVYLHNPADKHDTHVSASIRALTALRELADVYRPETVYGCEVWRGLDWVNDEEKKVLDVSERPALKAALLGVFDSQIEGGKRYDLAALGRYEANATFYASHDTDKLNAAIYALDLTPLLDGGSIEDYIDGYIRRFSQDVKGRLRRLQG